MVRHEPKSASAIDTRIGERIRLRRHELGLTQSDVGHKIGVAFQQVQKYEVGTNRVSASRLLVLAEVLDVPVGYFLGIGDAAAGIETVDVAGSIGLLAERRAVELLKYFRAMTAPQRNALLEMARAAAEANAVMDAATSSEQPDESVRPRKACLAVASSPVGL